MERRNKTHIRRLYIVGRTGCGVVDRREIDGKELKTAVEKICNPWMNNNIRKERSNGKSKESGEGFGRHGICRER